MKESCASSQPGIPNLGSKGQGWFDLSEIGNQAIEDVRLAAAEKEIRINVEPPEIFEPLVGAPRRLRQVMSNLLNNAIRYSPAGSMITFRAWYEPDEVYFSVEDEGPGIPEEDFQYQVPRPD